MTTFAGIPADRLEELELRLKKDVISESAEYQGKILLHGEADDGKILGVWELVQEDRTQTPKEVFTQLAEVAGNINPENAKKLFRSQSSQYLQEPENLDFLSSTSLSYFRVPVTAGEPLEPTDFDAMIQVFCNAAPFDKNTFFVFNCQIGIGRSTIGEVVGLLILDWLGEDVLSSQMSKATTPLDQYEVVLSLLRVIRSAIDTKKRVDTAIDMCTRFTNLRESISDAYNELQTEGHSVSKKNVLKKGMRMLKRFSFFFFSINFFKKKNDETIKIN